MNICEKCDAQQTECIDCQDGETIASEHVTRSGHLAYFPYAEHTYSLSTLLCACAGIAIELAADGTAREYINATYTCAQHGTHQSTAIRCATTPQHKPSPVFAWVEKRHARDSRVQWGMAQRRTS